MNRLISLTLLTVVLLISYAGEAQIAKGQLMLGGNLSFSKNLTHIDETPSGKTVSFSVQPQLGISLGHNWIIGIQANYVRAKQTGGPLPNFEAELSGYGGGLFARKFTSLHSQFGFFGQVNAIAVSSKGEATTNDLKPKVTSLSGDLQPGFYFLPGKKIILECTFASLYFTHVKTKNGGIFAGSEENELGLSITDGVSFGIKYIL